MLTPSKYWRVEPNGNSARENPPEVFCIGERLAGYSASPISGHGITIASFDSQARTGHLSWVGVIQGGSGTVRSVDWRPTSARIDVDSAQGAKFWESGAFAFASTKVADYGLHELWQEHFGMELRDSTPNIVRPVRLAIQRQSMVAPERLNPIEVAGTPTSGPRAGVVYVLKSALGFKVGRTANVPARMRAFGVKLPFIYTIPLCAWFEDCHEAERRYHQRFAGKRINGEWFDLGDEDVEAIRARI